MKIKEIEFIGSFEHEHQCPKDGLPEYAFIGRSNVGKSSLIMQLQVERHWLEFLQHQVKPNILIISRSIMHGIWLIYLVMDMRRYQRHLGVSGKQ